MVRRGFEQLGSMFCVRRVGVKKDFKLTEYISFDFSSLNFIDFKLTSNISSAI